MEVSLGQALAAVGIQCHPRHGGVDHKIVRDGGNISGLCDASIGKTNAGVASRSTSETVVLTPSSFMSILPVLLMISLRWSPLGVIDTLSGAQAECRRIGWADHADTPSRGTGRGCHCGTASVGGPKRAVVRGGEVGLDFRARRHQ